MNCILVFRRFVERGDHVLTRPIRLDSHPRLKVAAMVLYAVGVLAMMASQMEWSWVTPARVWILLRKGVPLLISGLPHLLPILLIWLAVWAGLAVLFAGLTTFCFGLIAGAHDREGLSRLCLMLVAECVLTGVLAVPIAVLLLAAWR